MSLPKIKIMLKPQGSSVEIDGHEIPYVRRITVDHLVGVVPVVTIDVITDKISVVCEGVEMDMGITDVVAGMMRKG